jgi:hypothetical protein
MVGGPGSGNFGHSGRLGEVGGSGPGSATYEKKIRDLNIHDFKTKYINSPVEHIIAYKNGVVDHESTTSDFSSCHIEDYVDMDMVHNHPSNSPGLSGPDIYLSIEGNAKSITALAPTGGSWTINRPQEGWEKWQENHIPGYKSGDNDRTRLFVRAAYEETTAEEAKTKETKEINRLLITGKITMDMANSMFSTNLAEKAIRSLGLSIEKRDNAEINNYVRIDSYGRVIK